MIALRSVPILYVTAWDERLSESMAMEVYRIEHLFIVVPQPSTLGLHVTSLHLQNVRRTFPDEVLVKRCP